MAKTKFNPALKGFRGEIDGFVYKQYANGTVVSRRPRMEHIKPSAAQLAQRERFRQAAAFHRTVLADPLLKRRYAAVAKKRQVPLSAVTLEEYMKANRVSTAALARNR